MKLYGAAIAFNIHARNAKEAQELVDYYLTRLRNEDGACLRDDRDPEGKEYPAVDSAEEINPLEELE